MPTWRRAPGRDLLWRRWDGNSAVFDATTGDTHVLDALASEILGRVGPASVTAEELSGRLGSDLDLPTDSTLVETVRQTLERFAALGLVEGTAN